MKRILLAWGVVVAAVVAWAGNPIDPQRARKDFPEIGMRQSDVEKLLGLPEEQLQSVKPEHYGVMVYRIKDSIEANVKIYYSRDFLVNRIDFTWETTENNPSSGRLREMPDSLVKLAAELCGNGRTWAKKSPTIYVRSDQKVMAKRMEKLVTFVGM
jgi:hypothetical protein